MKKHAPKTHCEKIVFFRYFILTKLVSVSLDFTNFLISQLFKDPILFDYLLLWREEYGMVKDYLHLIVNIITVFTLCMPVKIIRFLFIFQFFIIAFMQIKSSNFPHISLLSILHKLLLINIIYVSELTLEKTKNDYQTQQKSRILDVSEQKNIISQP